MRGQPKRTPVHPTFGYNRAPHVKPSPNLEPDMGRADQARSTACGGNPARTAALGAKGLFRPVATRRPAITGIELSRCRGIGDRCKVGRSAGMITVRRDAVRTQGRAP